MIVLGAALWLSAYLVGLWRARTLHRIDTASGATLAGLAYPIAGVVVGGILLLRVHDWLTVFALPAWFWFMLAEVRHPSDRSLLRTLRGIAFVLGLLAGGLVAAVAIVEA